MSRRRQLFALVVFAAGVIAAVIAFQLPATRELFTNLERSGYPGAFVTGILYALSFTAASATVVFAQIPDTLNPALVAIVGGLGSFLYDVTVFAFFRHWSHRKIVEIVREKLPARRRVPPWLMVVLGALIIASPLPDELAAGMLGLGTIRPMRFFLLSFIFNTLGIFVITGLG